MAGEGAGVQRLVQVAVLRQLVNGRANRRTTVAMVAGSDYRDFRVALDRLLAQGEIVHAAGADPGGLEALETLARSGLLVLTDEGKRRLDEDDA